MEETLECLQENPSYVQTDPTTRMRSCKRVRSNSLSLDPVLHTLASAVRGRALMHLICSLLRAGNLVLLAAIEPAAGVV